jgi:hypothetical protein
MDFSWIARRVESVSLENDVGHWNHQTSLDLDMDELRKRIQESGIPGSTTDFAIPVDTIRKGLIIQFNVIDQHGNTKSLATSDIDSRIAQLAILGHILSIDENLFNLIFLNTDSPNRLSEIADEIYAVIHDMEITAVDDLPDRYERTKTKWELLLQHQSFRNLLSRFLSNFPLIVNVNSAENEAIIKYQYIEVGKYKSGSPILLGRTGTVFHFENPRIGEAQREHLHLDAPPETEFSHTPVLFDKTPERYSNDVSATPVFYAKTTPRRISFYSQAKIEDSDRYAIIVGLRPKPTGFLSYALLGLTLSLIITVVFLIWQIGLQCTTDISLSAFVNALFARADVGANMMPVVTLSQLFTNLFLAQIFMRWHNAFRNRIMNSACSLMIISMILGTFSCAFLIADFPAVSLIWFFICLFDTVGIVFVIGWKCNASKHRKNVIDGSNMTYPITPICSHHTRQFQELPQVGRGEADATVGSCLD